MQITFNIELSDSDQAALATALGCPPNELQQELFRHALAALHEHVECYLGRRASTRGNDILEYRLALLIGHAFKNKIPSDATVSRLFQTTLTASRTLIRNALAKYRIQLVDASAASAKAVLETATWPGGNGDDYLANNPAANVVDLLNQRLLVEDPTMKRIGRVPESGGVYAINKYSYDKLCGAFNAAKVARP
ncbi:hypothetical protein [Mesorhizobium sp. CO1-1-4]|uniref:hypothetical protein n=1 Tax=Mesorhizobium sp. CO1-1-4 TaxID=2876633 RepID=UPI001CCFBE75|nr:hypothetical protein [Mesorhizobium sp. CO1-1-4]MBZ9740683.1 hypothetical protein [Mesorhizobium sp. CO1-1-4]